MGPSGTGARLEGPRHIHPDQHARALFVRGGEREVVEDAAVHEEKRVGLHGLEDERHRRTRGHGAGKAAAVERDQATGAQIGDGGAERHTEGVEITAGSELRGERVARVDLLRSGGAGERLIQLEAPLAGEVEREQSRAVLARLGDSPVAAAVGTGEKNLPVETSGEGLDLLRRVPRGVESADDGTHAAAHDQVRSDAGLLEGAEHAEVSQPAGAASAQDERKAGGGVLLRRRVRDLRRRSLGAAPRPQGREEGR